MQGHITLSWAFFMGEAVPGGHSVMKMPITGCSNGFPEWCSYALPGGRYWPGARIYCRIVLSHKNAFLVEGVQLCLLGLIFLNYYTKVTWKALPVS